MQTIQTLAAEILDTVLSGKNLTDTLASAWRQHPALAPAERAAVMDISYGSLRHYGWLRGVLGAVLDALEHLHQEGVFHRDIAPDNILLTREGAPILLDFGAARRVISNHTQAFTAILKPSYAPIEQYAEMSSMRQGPWTDLYALGAVMHFLLTGKPPMPSTARAVQPGADMLDLHESAEVSPRFVQIVGWMLSVRPQDRPQSVAELRAAGKPVFVDFTAAWCVTCQYNKKTTLANEEVWGAFERAKVRTFRADWTRRDAAITAELARLGRSGVPVYLLQAPGKPPIVLSEILSVADVKQALERTLGVPIFQEQAIKLAMVAAGFSGARNSADCGLGIRPAACSSCCSVPSRS